MAQGILHDNQLVVVSCSAAQQMSRFVHDNPIAILGFQALNASFDATTPMGRAFLRIRAAFAGMERNVIRQRVKEGIAAARVRGRKGGRPRLMTPERLRYAQRLMANRTRSIPAICRDLLRPGAAAAPRLQAGLYPLPIARPRPESCSTIV